MKRLHTRPFVGVCGPNARQVFRALGTPTAARFPEYFAVIGPFRTVRGARWAASHPQGFAVVSEAERKARAAALAAAEDGTSGQDRKSYSDTQDRDTYRA